MKALRVFWAVVVLALLGGAGWLHVLGPPEHRMASVASPPPTAAPAETARPIPPVAEPQSPTNPAPAEAGRGEPNPAEPGGAEADRVAQAGPIRPVSVPLPAPSEPVAPRPVQQATLPTAPEPPPLPRLAEPAVASAERPIPPPDPALLEPSPHGPVPRVGPEGRTSIRAYARTFDRSDTRPRVALIIGNLGLSASLSEEAIRRLPPATTLAFSPYAFRPGSLLEQARARGMEVLTALPLEPAGYPLNDPGERGLLTGATPAENADRLLWVLSRIQGQVGAVGALGPMRGERFAAVPDLLNGLQDSLRARGLLYLDPRPGAVPPARSFGRTVDIVVDEPATRGEIERRLAELERLARERGTAGVLGLASDPAPVLVDRVIAWAAGLEERGLVLAPITSLIRRGEEVPR